MTSSESLSVVIRIQRSWRSYQNRKIYVALRTLLNAHQNGDPHAVLRWLNPLEASLVEPAAGLHVRLRLGGEKFPPNVYYKIFTHRPIIDVCSFCPRDYANQTSEWYERIENNPWRSVDGRALERRSRFGEANFRYFAKETRKEVKEKQREKRVLKWMLWKLPQDDDVDDLLSWSQALDYDAYIRCLWNAQVLKGFFLVNGTHVAAQEAVQPFLPFRETKKRKGDCKERVRKAGTCNTFPILDLTFKSVCS